MPRRTWRRPGATPAEATPPHGAGDSEDNSRSPACTRFWNYLPAALKESCMQRCLLASPHFAFLLRNSLSGSILQGCGRQDPGAGVDDNGVTSGHYGLISEIASPFSLSL